MWRGMCVFLFLLLYFPLDKETQGHEESILEAKETLEHLKNERRVAQSKSSDAII
jgi:hypothetical protein